MKKSSAPSFITDEADANEALFMHDIARLLKKNFDRRARGIGLTRAQWLMIGTLRRNPGIKQSELAEMLDVTPITVARSIDRLEKSGWIERRSDAADRRVKRLFLTKRVQGVVAKIRVLALENRRAALRGVTAQEHRLLLALLHKIKHNLSTFDKMASL